MYDEKISDNSPKCTEDIIYQPLVWTSLGALSSGTEETLRIIICRLSQVKECSLTQAADYIYGVFSVCLQSWNANMTNKIMEKLSPLCF